MTIVQEWLARPGCRIVSRFEPADCPRFNPIEPRSGVMHKSVTRNKRYETINVLAAATLAFPRTQVPKRFGEFA